MALLLPPLVAIGGCGGGAPSRADAGVERADGRPRVLGPEAGDYLLSWSCDAGCEGGAPFSYHDRLRIGRDASAAELRYRRTSCGAACDAIDSAQESGACLEARGIPLGGDAGATDPYALCPDVGGPSAAVRWRGYPGPSDVEKIWWLEAMPAD